MTDKLRDRHDRHPPDDPVARFFEGDMECEQHEGVAWPHDDCTGPGMPWRTTPTPPAAPEQE